MLINLDLDGKVEIIDIENIYQGSNAVNKIVVQSKMNEKTAIELYFILPDKNKTRLGGYPMSVLKRIKDGINFWEYTIKNDVTAFVGTVDIIINTISYNVIGNIVANKTSSKCSFNVLEGALPDLSQAVDEDTYALILSYMQRAAYLDKENIFEKTNEFTQGIKTSQIHRVDENAKINITSDIDLNNNIINNVSDPILEKDVANKEYVDNLDDEIKQTMQENKDEINDKIKDDLIEFGYNEETGEATKIYRNGERETFPIGGTGVEGLGFELINFTIAEWKQLANSSWQLQISNTRTGFSDDNFVAIMEILDESTNTYYSSVEEFKRNADGSLTITNSVVPYAGRFVIPISGKAVGVLTVDTIHNLPNVGNQYTVYVVKADNKSYRYDNVDHKYYCISGTDWHDITAIDGNL